MQCDETRPTCKNCSRYFQNAGACQWIEQGKLAEKQGPFLTKVSHDAYRRGPVHVRSVPNLGPRGGMTDHASPQEVRLFHHFTTVTCETLPLCPDPAALHLWAYAVPQIASEPGYLRSALLATAALHYHDLQPGDGSMLERASHFYGRSLRALSKDMAKPDASNAEQLVMASLLISLLSSRFTRTLSNSKTFTPALEYFRVAKGNAALLGATAKWIKDSPLKEYLASGSRTLIDVDIRAPSPTSHQSSLDSDTSTSPTKPKQNFLFVHQSGPALDGHAISTVRSRVMSDYRSSKRKRVKQQRIEGVPNAIAQTREPQASSNRKTTAVGLLDAITSPTDPTFSYLLCDVSPEHPSYDAYSTYLGQLNANLFAIRNGEPEHFFQRRLSTMPARTPMEFIELIERRDQRALVMMMHHYALLKLVDDAWWIKGTAEYNFEGLIGMVGHEWDWALQGPTMIMEHRKGDGT